MDDFSSNGGLWLFAILALMWGGATTTAADSYVILRTPCYA